jgi:DNA-binding NarL/FixJ family response regulator
MSGTQPADVSAVISIRLAIVHGYVAALEGLSGWLDANAPEIEVVVRARSWEEARAQRGAQPQVYLLDLQSLSASSLVDLIAEARSDGAAVVAWGDLDDEMTLARLRGTGVASVLGRSNSIDDARAAVIDAVVLGRKSWTGELVPVGHGRASLAAQAGGGSSRILAAQAGSQAAQPSGLSDADIEVVRLYAIGNSPIDIALRMNVRFDRVRDHLARVRDYYEAQGRRASNRLDMVQRASEDGLLEA